MRDSVAAKNIVKQRTGRWRLKEAEQTQSSSDKNKNCFGSAWKGLNKKFPAEDMELRKKKGWNKSG